MIEEKKLNDAFSPQRLSVMKSGLYDAHSRIPGFGEAYLQAPSSMNRMNHEQYF